MSIDLKTGEILTPYTYYELKIKLIRPMLGSNPQASIYDEHVIQKAKKQIATANRLKKKMTKALDKYAGSEIPELKEISDLQGIIRTYQQLLGKALEVPDSINELLELSEQLEIDFDEMLEKGAEKKATVFMRDGAGWPVISSHMILGNMKEIIKILVNNGEKILPTKVSVGETLAMDVKPVQEYMRPSNDIMRKPDGTRDLLERPLSFERMGKKETAIAVSEQLPEGTEFECTLRIRSTSVFADILTLKRVFAYGKNLGLGTWRGSGNRGAYLFKLEHLPEYHEESLDGWE